MKRLLLLSFLVASITLTGFFACKSSSSATTAKLLKFNLQKGKGYDYDMVWDITSAAMGQETKISMDALYSMNIMEDDGHVKTVSTSYKSIRMNMQTMGMTIDMDSNNPMTDNGDSDLKKNPMGLMNKIFTGMVNKPFFVKVNEDGQVVEVGGFEKIVSDLVDSIGLSDEMKQQLMASMKDQFNSESLKDNFSQLFTFLPNKEVKVGDTWEKSYTTMGKMTAKYTTVYTVKGIDGDEVSLSADSKISSASEEPKMDGKQTGNILVDSKTGLMINGEFTQDFDMTSGGIKIGITGKGKIKGKAN